MKKADRSSQLTDSCLLFFIVQNILHPVWLTVMFQSLTV